MCPEHPKETTATCFSFSVLLNDYSKIKMTKINNRKSFFLSAADLLKFPAESVDICCMCIKKFKDVTILLLHC